MFTALSHEVLLSFGPIGRLKRVVDIGEDFVEEGLAGLRCLFTSLGLGGCSPDRRQLAMLILSSHHANLMCLLDTSHGGFLLNCHDIRKGHGRRRLQNRLFLFFS